MNTKDARIFKLYLRGLTLEQISRKIGMPGDIERVKAGLLRKGIAPTGSYKSWLDIDTEV